MVAIVPNSLTSCAGGSFIFNFLNSNADAVPGSVSVDPYVFTFDAPLDATTSKFSAPQSVLTPYLYEFHNSQVSAPVFSFAVNDDLASIFTGLTVASQNPCSSTEKAECAKANHVTEPKHTEIRNDELSELQSGYTFVPADGNFVPTTSSPVLAPKAIRASKPIRFDFERSIFSPELHLSSPSPVPEPPVCYAFDFSKRQEEPHSAPQQNGFPEPFVWNF